MIKDKIENINKYIGLDDRLRNIDRYKNEKNRQYREFSVDKEATNIFIVNSKSITAATGWRENRENREVTGVMTVNEGEFVLYLPGEPFALKNEDALIEHRRLK